MNNNSSTDESISSPSIDAPELRINASSIPQFRDVVPVSRRFATWVELPIVETDGVWVPITEDTKSNTSELELETTKEKKTELFFTTVAIVLPIGLVVGTIFFIYRWFGFA
jgi:hypothetical protein